MESGIASTNIDALKKVHKVLLGISEEMGVRPSALVGASMLTSVASNSHIPVDTLSSALRNTHIGLRYSAPILNVAAVGALLYEQGGSLIESLVAGGLGAYVIKCCSDNNLFRMPGSHLDSGFIKNVASRTVAGTVRTMPAVGAVNAGVDSVGNYQSLSKQGHSPSAALIGATAGGIVQIGANLLGGVLVASSIPEIASGAAAPLGFASAAAGFGLMATAPQSGAAAAKGVACASDYLLDQAPKLAGMISDFFDEVSRSIPNPIQAHQIPIATMDGYFESALSRHLDKVAQENLTPQQAAFYLSILEEQFSKSIIINNGFVTFNPKKIVSNARPGAGLGPEIQQSWASLCHHLSHKGEYFMTNKKTFLNRPFSTSTDPEQFLQRLGVTLAGSQAEIAHNLKSIREILERTEAKAIDAANRQQWFGHIQNINTMSDDFKKIPGCEKLGVVVSACGKIMDSFGKMENFSALASTSFLSSITSGLSFLAGPVGILSAVFSLGSLFGGGDADAFEALFKAIRDLHESMNAQFKKSFENQQKIFDVAFETLNYLRSHSITMNHRLDIIQKSLDNISAIIETEDEKWALASVKSFMYQLSHNRSSINSRDLVSIQEIFDTRASENKQITGAQLSSSALGGDSKRYLGHFYSYIKNELKISIPDIGEQDLFNVDLWGKSIQAYLEGLKVINTPEAHALSQAPLTKAKEHGDNALAFIEFLRTTPQIYQKLFDGYQAALSEIEPFVLRVVFEHLKKGTASTVSLGSIDHFIKQSNPEFEIKFNELTQALDKNIAILLSLGELCGFAPEYFEKINSLKNAETIRNAPVQAIYENAKNAEDHLKEAFDRYDIDLLIQSVKYVDLETERNTARRFLTEFVKNDCVIKKADKNWWDDLGKPYELVIKKYNGEEIKDFELKQEIYGDQSIRGLTRVPKNNRTVTIKLKTHFYGSHGQLWKDGITAFALKGFHYLNETEMKKLCFEADYIKFLKNLDNASLKLAHDFYFNNKGVKIDGLNVRYLLLACSIFGSWEPMGRFLNLGGKLETADLDAGLTENMQPVMVAVRCGRFEVVKKLAEHGADLNFTAVDGLSPFWAAVYCDRSEMIEFFKTKKFTITKFRELFEVKASEKLIINLDRNILYAPFFSVKEDPWAYEWGDIKNKSTLIESAMIPIIFESVNRFKSETSIRTMQLVRDLLPFEGLDQWIRDHQHDQPSIPANPVQKIFFDDLNLSPFIRAHIVSQQSKTLGFIECYIAGTMGIIAEALAAPAPVPVIRVTEAAPPPPPQGVRDNIQDHRPRTPTDYDRLHKAFSTLEVAVEERNFSQAKVERKSVIRLADHMTDFFNRVGQNHHAFQRVREMRDAVNTNGRFSPNKLQ